MHPRYRRRARPPRGSEEWEHARCELHELIAFFAEVAERRRTLPSDDVVGLPWRRRGAGLEWVDSWVVRGPKSLPMAWAA